jgi:acetamidase/formamidase
MRHVALPWPIHPLQAHPGGWLQVSVFWMQVSPHAFPVVQTLQQFGPDELPHAAVRGGPLAAASVSASAPARRTLFQIKRTVYT